MFLNLKRNFVFLDYSINNIKILNLLWKIKIINGFKLFIGKKLKIFLNFNKFGKPIFSKVSFFSRNRNKFIILNSKYLIRNLNYFILIILKNKIYLIKDFFLIVYHLFSLTFFYCFF